MDSAVASEFIVNQFTDFPPGEAAEDPAIATDRNNHIIITWEDTRYSDDNVFARIFDNIGNPLTNDFRVGQDPNDGSDPSIAVDSNDHFIITWEETRSDQNPENDDIFARIFDSTGNPLTNEYRVDQDTGTNEALEPVIATDGNNNFIIAWTDYRSGHSDIFAIIEVSPGDANGDGSINVLDVISIINVVLDTGTASGSPDCNGDGHVNVLDVICVINKILGG